MKKITIAIFCLLLTGSFLSEGDDMVPSYTVKRTTGKIYVDGNPTEADWKAASPVGDFVFPWYKEGKKEQTEVKALWDDEYLYILYKCEDEHISAHYFERNSAPYKDDCIEAFIAPNPEHPLWYTNYEINCLGTWLAGLHKDSFNEYVLPDKILIGRSHVGTINNEDDIDSHWIIEIGIPFENLKDFEIKLPPKNGTVWGINFNRCGGDINQQYSQWSPSKTEQPNFHRPQDFGKIIFSDKKVR
jgi:hypothetical protein